MSAKCQLNDVIHPILLVHSEVKVSTYSAVSILTAFLVLEIMVGIIFYTVNTAKLSSFKAKYCIKLKLP